ncbi:MAG: carboxypeptidase-like regulatory domain-containing protein, partial [Flavobacteriaceae bacterium]|nr:carboxypeptidase-like regulatory domain-containing protein [Flavobacteriaceae bacterium]
MKTKIIYALLFFPFLIFAQVRTISGKVTSSDGVPIPSVNVLIKNTSKGVVTDFDGNFNIAANQNDVLVFSYIGMKSKEIVIGLSDIINVKLEDSAESLEEVVVIGYG